MAVGAAWHGNSPFDRTFNLVPLTKRDFILLWDSDKTAKSNNRAEIRMRSRFEVKG